MSKFFKELGWYFSGAFGWVIKIIATILVIAIVSGSICVTIFAVYIDKYIRPSLETINMDDLTLNYTSYVYAIDKETGDEVMLEELYSDVNRVWINYSEMSPYLGQAIIAIEDNRFNEHKGVDWVRTAGAMVNMVIPLRSNYGGGSTITQQLIKNLTGEDDVTVQRKLQEILRALEFEKHYSKEEILEMYLNVIYFGHSCYGVESASRYYFDKAASELTIAEAACLAAIPNSPTYYDPLKYPEHNTERRERILKNMFEQEMISEYTYKAALNESLNFSGSTAFKEKTYQSYYTDQVITDVLQDLQQKLGYTYQAAFNLLYGGGLKIYSCVDLEIQAIVDDYYQNAADFPTTLDEAEGDRPESAMVIMNNETGEVAAMIGGRGEKTIDRAWNRATMARRSPGSTVKPITVYAPALEYDVITPYSVFDDSPLWEDEMYPKNQTSGYSGRMTVLNAVKKSTNTVAMKVLDTLGLERSFRFATENMGLGLVESKEINGRTFTDIAYSALSLGGMTYGVTVEEMTAAYTSFANDGVYTKPRTYSKVLDSKGNVILENEKETKVAMSEDTAYYINYMLQEVVTSGTGTRARLSNMAVAGKTGTTTDDCDRWFAGYTPYYTAVVWYGYENPRELRMTSSTNPAVYIWEKIMSQVHEGLEYRSFTTRDLVAVQYCLDCGKKAGSLCSYDIRGSRVATGYFLAGDEPTEDCDCHVTVKICAGSGNLANAFCPSVREVTVIDVERTGKVSMADDPYTAANFKHICTLHTSAPVETEVPGEEVPPEESGPAESGNTRETAATAGN